MLIRLSRKSFPICGLTFSCPRDRLLTRMNRDSICTATGRKCCNPTRSISHRKGSGFKLGGVPHQTRSFGRRLPIIRCRLRRRRRWRILSLVGLRKSIPQPVCRQGQSRHYWQLIDDYKIVPHYSHATSPRRFHPETAWPVVWLYVGRITSVGVCPYTHHSNGRAVDEQCNGDYATEQQTDRYRYSGQGCTRSDGAGYRANAQTNRR